MSYLLNKASAKFFRDAGAHLVKALAEGKSLQYRMLDTTNWIDADGPRPCNFDPNVAEWRVKPEPRSVYVLYRGDGTAVGIPYTYEAKAKEDLRFYNEVHARNHGPYVLKEFREVM